MLQIQHSTSTSNTEKNILSVNDEVVLSKEKSGRKEVADLHVFPFFLKAQKIDLLSDFLIGIQADLPLKVRRNSRFPRHLSQIHPIQVRLFLDGCVPTINWLKKDPS